MTTTSDNFSQPPAVVVHGFIANREGFVAAVDAKDPNQGLLAWEAAYLYCGKEDALRALELEVLGHGLEFRRPQVPDEEEERMSGEFAFNISYGHILRSLLADLAVGKLLASGFSQGSANANQREFIRPERWAGLNLQVFRSEATSNGVTITNILIFPHTAPTARQFLSGLNVRSLPRPTSRHTLAQVPDAKLKRWLENFVEPACIEMGVRLNVNLAVKLGKAIHGEGVTNLQMRRLFPLAQAIKSKPGRPRGSAALPSEDQLEILRMRLIRAHLDGLDGRNR